MTTHGTPLTAERVLELDEITRDVYREPRKNPWMSEDQRDRYWSSIIEADRVYRRLPPDEQKRYQSMRRH